MGLGEEKTALQKHWINGELALPRPEGFVVMSPEELARAYTCDNSDRWGMWDKKRHIMVTVLWQRYNPLLAWLADMKTLVKRNEQLTSRGYKDHDYRLEGFRSRDVRGMAGEGYRFTYRLGDVVQRIDTVLVKKGRTVYSLSCIGRPENSAVDQAVFEAILDGIEAR